MKSILKIGLVAIVTLLTGCNTLNLNSQFDCPNQAGVRCKSLDKINDMVNNGELPKQAQSPCSGSSQYTGHAWGRWKQSGCAPINLGFEKPVFETYLGQSMINADEPYRSPEQVQRVWIAAYEDTEGNYHQETMIYTVSEKSHWVQPIFSPTIKIEETSLYKGA